jgi:hypothetical protein
MLIRLMQEGCGWAMDRAKPADSGTGCLRSVLWDRGVISCCGRPAS